jgi:hypothetical protein
MSRSRRKQKPGKCICGRGLIPYAGNGHHLRHPDADCPVLSTVLDYNDRFWTFVKKKAGLNRHDERYER